MSAPSQPILTVRDVAKSFTMHLRGGIRLPVVEAASFTVAPGECVVLGGPSGVGKSSILRMVYGNYAVDAGEILIRDGATGNETDLASGDPRHLGRQVGLVRVRVRVRVRVSLGRCDEPEVSRWRAGGGVW